MEKDKGFIQFFNDIRYINKKDKDRVDIVAKDKHRVKLDDLVIGNSYFVDENNFDKPLSSPLISSFNNLKLCTLLAMDYTMNGTSINLLFSKPDGIRFKVSFSKSKLNKLNVYNVKFDSGWIEHNYISLHYMTQNHRFNLKISDNGKISSYRK